MNKSVEACSHRVSLFQVHTTTALFESGALGLWGVFLRHNDSVVIEA